MRSRFLQLLTFVFLLVGNIAFAQSKEISGVVLDENNLELPGASVIVKGKSVGTTTDFEGNFAIQASEGDVIEIGFIGYLTVELNVGENTSYIVKLVPDTKALDEVIVVGYGKVNKESFTGSATQVKGTDIAAVAVPTITDALQGQSAGLQITSANGDPGSGSTMRIRGIGSMKTNSAPLYVIDGAIVSGGITSINPNDIASMTVLKDASATAIYGARAANGVILITTKTGKKGSVNISLDTKFGVYQLPNRGYNLMSSADHYKHYYDYFRSEGVPMDQSNAYVLQVLSGNNPYNMINPLDDNGNVVDGARIITNTDWVDEVFRTGKTQEYNVSASGGTENTNYFISLGYADTEGIVKGANFTRYNFRLNLNTKLTKRITLGTNSSFYYTDRESGARGSSGAAPTRNALLYPNAVSVYEIDSEGNVQYDENGKPIYNFNNPVSRDYNPLFTIENDIASSKVYRLLSNMYLNVDLGFLLNGLSFRTDNSVDFNTLKSFSFDNPFHGDGSAVGGRGSSSGTWNSLITTSNRFNYKKAFGDHKFEVLAGFEASQNQTNTNYAEATSYAVYADVVLPELGNATTPVGASSSESKWSMLSYLGRVNYDYHDRYYFSASIRRDGSSRFGENKRFGTFYSLGASWRLSEEEFMNNATWLDNLKLRASYGTSGNDQIGMFAYLANFQDADYDGNPGVILYRPGNKELSWETSKSATFGVDFAMFAHRLSGTIEYYNRKTDDLLYNVPISMSSGFDSVTRNSASLKNSGIEITLDYRLMKVGDFAWDMGINYTINKNVITYLPTGEDVLHTKIWKEGGSVYDFYLRDYAGVDKNDGLAMWYKDVLDGDGKPTGDREPTKDYNEATRYVVGSSQPDGYGGFNNTFTYKGFSLNANVFFSNGGKILDFVEMDLMNDGNKVGYQMIDEAKNAWKNPGDVTDVPRFNVMDKTSSNMMSTRYLYDATYVKLKAVTLAYQIPTSFAKKLGMTSMSTYISGNNLFVWVKDKGFKGFDPEVGLTGQTGYVTPNPSSLVMGVKLNF